MTPRESARLLMEAIAILHSRGYGRLKLYCYFKEGLGAWRHVLFAADVCPRSIGEVPQPSVGGSFPGPPASVGTSAMEMADQIVASYPKLMSVAQGLDPIYVGWYLKTLQGHPKGILEMECATSANMSGIPISPP